MFGSEVNSVDKFMIAFCNDEGKILRKHGYNIQKFFMMSARDRQWIYKYTKIAMLPKISST